MKKFRLFSVFCFILVFSFLFSKSISWHSYNQGYEKALKQNKSLFLYVGSSWCGWCKMMEKKVFSDKEVIKLLKENFVLARISLDKKETSFIYQGKKISFFEFLKKFKIEKTPYIALFNEYGYVDSVIGYSEKRKLFEWIKAYKKYIATNKCKNKVSFKKYMRSRRCMP